MRVEGEPTCRDHLTQAVVARLGARWAVRTEADIQSDIQTLLCAGDLNLSVDDVPKLEEQLADGTRRRIDIAICHAVIEVKKDLRNATQLADAEKQLAGYVATRRGQSGRRFVGIASDGVLWILYDLRDDETLQRVSELSNAGDPDRLLVWLEAVLASQEQVPPTPLEIERRLGSKSPGHLLDFRELFALYEANRAVPEIVLKRELWARLLRTAFGSAFVDDSAAFINHTLLVLTAEVIAHAVLGIDVAATGLVSAEDLVSGRAFDDYGIHGVVEPDFFDWVVAVPGGVSFVRTLAARIARFDWDAVEHDVLKHLYESVISTESRQRLGRCHGPVAVWETDLEPITGACGRTFDGGPLDGDGLWSSHRPEARPDVMELARRLAAEATLTAAIVRRRHTEIITKGYEAFVCPHCQATLGDFHLRTDLLYAKMDSDGDPAVQDTLLLSSIAVAEHAPHWCLDQGQGQGLCPPGASPAPHKEADA